jgi:SsrA-binding protein
MKILTENKKALFDYQIYEKFEAGIKLSGLETKSAKLGRFNISGSYALIKNNEVWLINSEIQSFEPNNTPKDYDSKRNRKLLLHKSEIKYLIGKLNQKFMLIPIKAYLKNNLIKIELGLAKTRKKIDKRELIKKREADKKIRRIIKKEIN